MFDEILNRAEKLSSQHTLAGRIADAAAQNHEPSAPTHPHVVDKQLGIDLTEIFRASESLVRKKLPGEARAQKSYLFGKHGIIFGGAPNISQAAAVEKVVVPDDEEAINVLTDRVRLEAERAFFNQVLLNRPHPSFHSVRPESSFGTNLPSTPMRPLPASVTGPRLGDRRAAIFSDRFRSYLRSDKRKDLSQLLNEAVIESNSDPVVADMWAQITAMVGKRCTSASGDVPIIMELVTRATNYLHKSFVDHMQRCVDQNLERARRGGIPGTRALAAAYIKGCCDIASDVEDGCLGDDCPVWQVIYTCFRSGDLAAASDALDKVATNQRTNVLYKALVHLKSNPKLTKELKDKLKVEWRHEQNSVRDLFRRSMYCALLGVEAPIADTMENWIWFKLIPLRLDPSMTEALYTDLQKTISLDYGEAHFMADGMNEAPLYFSALCLSGQFERAIDLLVQMNCLVDAVHMAILAHENSLLRLTDAIMDAHNIKLLNSTDQSVDASISLARLLVAYTKPFEMDDIETTLDYFYILKDQKTAQGRDIFESAVSRVLYLTGEVRKVIGEIKSSKRTAALIDNYDIDTTAVITRVAEDTELSGNPDQAIEILHICGEDDRAITVMCKRLAEAITQNDEKLRERLIGAAQKLATDAPAASHERIQTLCVLLDTLQLLIRCQQADYESVLHIIKKTGLIPTDPEQVHAFTSQEHLTPPQVTTVLPDVCLAVMNCLAVGFPQSTIPVQQRMQRLGQAIVMFAASTAYKFPQNIISKILVTQAKIQ
ncbi:unnamed protein product, partial [Mesorhabditis belari]|uniref:Nuclear pore protein n=1 Tax=Mesorhabditis belari TaxID=2138241 RepID=A0AAF3EEF7_9BILA